MPELKEQARPGFSFTNVLLVVVIVGVFGAPAYFSWVQSRLPGPERYYPVCLSRLKQLSLSTFMYAEDYDERLPLFSHSVDLSRVSKTPLGGADEQQWWRLLSGPKYGKPECLECSEEGAPPMPPKATIGRVGFMMNRAVESLSLSQVEDPRRVALFLEARKSGLKAWFEPPRDVDYSKESVIGWYRQARGLYIGFLDGSARPLPVEKANADPCGLPWSGVEYMRRFPIPEVPARPPLFTRTCPK